MFKLKRKTHKRFSKIVCTAISVAMILTTLFTFTASAESNNVINTANKWSNVEKGTDLYYQALSVLNLTESELEDCNIYSISSTPDSTRGVSIPNNTTYMFNEFTFYNSNVGSYWTCNGSELKWGFVWYVPGASELTGHYLRVHLYQWPNTFINSSGDIRTWTYNSNWMSAAHCDYRFKYWTAMDANPNATAYAQVTMFVATRN